MKENLRPCTVNIAEVTERYRTTKNAGFQTRVIKEAETHKGYFHKWIDEGTSSDCQSIMGSHGLVEYEDGTVHKVPPESIVFTDRKKVTINIDSDVIAKAAAEMMKD